MDLRVAVTRLMRRSAQGRGLYASGPPTRAAIHWPCRYAVFVAQSGELGTTALNDVA